MPIFRPAFQALQRNYGALFFYMGISCLVSGARLAVDTYVFPDLPREDADSLTRAYMMGIDIVVFALLAFAQTISFSRMGREIDRPMWRIENDREALVLFYRLWFLLALTQLTTERILVLVIHDSTDASVVLVVFMTWLLFISLLVPFGAAVMFYGRAGRQEIGLAFSTMGRHFPTVMLIAFMGVIFGMTMNDLQADLPPISVPALAILGGYLDCFMFACMWLVCIHHRDEIDDEDDDFNF